MEVSHSKSLVIWESLNNKLVCLTGSSYANSDHFSGFSAVIAMPLHYSSPFIISFTFHRVIYQ